VAAVHRIDDRIRQARRGRDCRGGDAKVMPAGSAFLQGFLSRRACGIIMRMSVVHDILIYFSKYYLIVIFIYINIFMYSFFAVFCICC
jgi:hypothetical protein